ncbi:hypothetical protein [uncultured Desulfovibrio sp.]|uniref:hypothetical protein n=1 Tax=uncultured Desulfovibrio sp. TaxID=167968 RepID=UPI0026256923|nr:hypothetical protein [uncultured Desulfovibrio sp.]
MIKAAGLWMPFSHLPENQFQFGSSDYTYREGCPLQPRLINISAVGARECGWTKLDFSKNSTAYKKEHPAGFPVQKQQQALQRTDHLANAWKAPAASFLLRLALRLQFILGSQRRNRASGLEARGQGRRGSHSGLGQQRLRYLGGKTRRTVNLSPVFCRAAIESGVLRA